MALFTTISYLFLSQVLLYVTQSCCVNEVSHGPLSIRVRFAELPQTKALFNTKTLPFLGYTYTYCVISAPVTCLLLSSVRNKSFQPSNISKLRTPQ